MPLRSELLGPPHSYYVWARCALDHPVFADLADATRCLEVIERVRSAFDARVFAYAIARNGLHLVVHHHPGVPLEEPWLRQRWAMLGSLRTPPPQRIAARLTSLSGLMQTLQQRISRAVNGAHGRSGAMWAARYRACLLADDAALLAAMAWLEEDVALHDDIVASSRGRHGQGATSDPHLAPPPLRVGPGDQWFPTDDGPPGLTPPADAELQEWVDRSNRSLPASARRAYGEALRQGWALGRPESLIAVLQRIGRGAGRGRSRSLRHLDDDLGLCGVWG
ncbi:MAG: hypothetical protein H0W72_06245 [Planctomycetes bacterium]|nr:hypothetical protein [Planctomycetota bacterium]